MHFKFLKLLQLFLFIFAGFIFFSFLKTDSYANVCIGKGYIDEVDARCVYPPSGKPECRKTTTRHDLGSCKISGQDGSSCNTTTNRCGVCINSSNSYISEDCAISYNSRTREWTCRVTGGGALTGEPRTGNCGTNSSFYTGGNYLQGCSCVECRSDSDCPGAQVCNSNNNCVCPPAPLCGNKECGFTSNSCGNTRNCGVNGTRQCPGDLVCNSNDQCVCPPAPLCGNKECGFTQNSCGNTRNCGVNGTRQCPGDQVCNANDQCVCPAPIVPSSWECGTVTNSCGRSTTRSCPGGQFCRNSDHQCVNCRNNGDCSNDRVCNAAGNCVCPAAPACGTRECGNTSNACGNTRNCGTCSPGFVCNSSGQCVCNSNSDCPGNQTCSGGSCVTRYACSGASCQITKGGTLTSSTCNNTCAQCDINTPCPNNQTCTNPSGGSCVTRYGCNTSNYTCGVVVGGPYLNLPTCTQNCVRPTPTPTPPPPIYTVNVSIFYDTSRSGANNISYQAGEECYAGGLNDIFTVRARGSADASATRYKYQSANYGADCLMSVATTNLNHTVRILRDNIPYPIKGYTYRDATTGGGYATVTAGNGNIEQNLQGSTIRFALDDTRCTPLTQAEACAGICSGTADNGCGTGTYTCSSSCTPPQVCGGSGLCANPTPTPALYTITGNIFIDSDKNESKNSAAEVNYSTTTGITATAGTVSFTSAGAYRVAGLAAGTYRVTYATPPGFDVTVPTVVGNPYFNVTVGPACVDPDGPTHDGTCVGGNVQNLNFGLTDASPWIDSIGGSIRFDSGFVNPVPLPADVNPSCGASTIKDAEGGGEPGLLISGGSIDSGQSPISSTNWKASGLRYTPAIPSTIRTSYAYISSSLQQAGITATALSGGGRCGAGGESNCTLSGAIPSGIYRTSGNLTLTTANYTFPASRRIVILVNGKLNINGQIHVPTTSSVVFSVKDDITVASNIGSALVTDSASHVEGIYSTDKNFVVDGAGNCSVAPDLRLNMAGAIITNASLTGGRFDNRRDACDKQCPVFSIKQRLDMLINMPNIIRVPSQVYKEVAP